MRFRFCPDCGTELVLRHAGDDGKVPFCEPCDKFWFDGFADTVLVLTYNEYGEIALSKQWYLSDRYESITSGFMVPGETAEKAALREVREELGLALSRLEYAGTYWFSQAEQLVHGFIGFCPKQEFVLSEEIEAAHWVPAEEAPDLMFPDFPGNPASEIYRVFMARNL